jgi:methionyl-tRNA formyltransferase
MSATCVVFAYHDVGVRCLSVLIEKGLDVRLVATHRDDPRENVFFASVEQLARRHGLDLEVSEDASSPALLARLQAIAPDFLFSFYYRRMLPPAVLAAARRGAFNMHGSLLPKYRGRAPVNWAVLRGERETGATLHEMVAKPDAGRIVDQEAVPIGPDDTAGEVFARVTDAAEAVLRRALPRLLDGTAALRPQDLAAGSYFGGRRPEDGRIDFSRPARAIHDLVRAVAPPYPGAFTEFRGATLKILRTRVAALPGAPRAPRLRVEEGRVFIDAADGGTLEVLELDHGGLSARAFCDNIGPGAFPLGNTPA